MESSAVEFIGPIIGLVILVLLIFLSKEVIRKWYRINEMLAESQKTNAYLKEILDQIKQKGV